MTENPPSRQAWVILVVGVLSQMAATIAITGPAFLIPYMHTDLGYTLTQAGTVAAAPSFGLILTLIAWGAFADRFGERLAMTLGIALTALASGIAVALVGSPVWMVLIIAASGAAAASVNSASGRVVMGWFPRHRRGLAMGIRQMSQPLGTSVAAVTVPPIAASGGFSAYLWFVVIVTGVMAVICFGLVKDPPRAEAVPSPVVTSTDAGQPGPTSARGASTASPATDNPYRMDSFLWRIHAVSALLVIPQFAFSTYGLIWLIANQHISVGIAGGIVAASQIVGAIGRLIVGGLSDRLGSRVGLMRVVAIAAVVFVAAIALIVADADADRSHSGVHPGVCDLGGRQRTGLRLGRRGGRPPLVGQGHGYAEHGTVRHVRAHGPGIRCTHHDLRLSAVLRLRRDRTPAQPGNHSETGH